MNAVTRDGSAATVFLTNFIKPPLCQSAHATTVKIVSGAHPKALINYLTLEPISHIIPVCHPKFSYTNFQPIRSFQLKKKFHPHFFLYFICTPICYFNFAFYFLKRKLSKTIVNKLFCLYFLEKGHTCLIAVLGCTKSSLGDMYTLAGNRNEWTHVTETSGRQHRMQARAFRDVGELMGSWWSSSKASDFKSCAQTPLIHCKTERKRESKDKSHAISLARQKDQEAKWRNRRKKSRKVERAQGGGGKRRG